MKKFCLYFFVAAALMCAQSASAAYRSVVVHRHDGSTVHIGIDRAVTAAITDGALVFSSSEGYVSLPAAEVWHWAFSSAEAPGDVWSGIDGVGRGEVTIERLDGSLVVRNLTAGAVVSIYAPDGRSVARGTAADDGTCVFDTDSLSHGIYLLTYGNHSIKIMLGR